MDSQLPYYPVIQTPGEGACPTDRERNKSSSTFPIPTLNPSILLGSRPGLPVPQKMFLHWFNEYTIQRPH